jgi:hypothetical protein
MGLCNRTHHLDCHSAGQPEPLTHTAPAGNRQGLDRIVERYRSYCIEAVTLGGYLPATDFGNLFPTSVSLKPLSKAGLKKQSNGNSPRKGD